MVIYLLAGGLAADLWLYASISAVRPQGQKRAPYLALVLLLPCCAL